VRIPRPHASHLRQVRSAELHRQHQGPDGAAHPREAYASGEIEPGDEIAEATSGNTGIAFAAIGRALGHPVRIYMPDWMSRERVLVIQSLGAAVIPVSHEQGGFLGSIRMADEYARDTRMCSGRGSSTAPDNVRAH
jgi:cysteine synthase A